MPEACGGWSGPWYGLGGRGAPVRNTKKKYSLGVASPVASVESEDGLATRLSRSQSRLSPLGTATGHRSGEHTRTGEEGESCAEFDRPCKILRPPRELFSIVPRYPSGVLSLDHIDVLH